MKLELFLSLSLVGLPGDRGQPPSPDPSAMLDHIVAVEYRSADGLKLGGGTGIVLERHPDGSLRCTTADHVVYPLRSSTVMGFTLVATDRNHAVAAVTVVASDELADVALIDIAPGLAATPADFANSRECSIGSPAWVAGNSAGKGLSLCRGVISRFDLSLVVTDAATNPGNSGGALYDDQGQVLGMVTEKLYRYSGGLLLEGIATAIPAHRLQQQIADLVAFGTVQPVFFGLDLVEDAGDAIRRRRTGNESEDFPVRVAAVHPGSPAEACGLQPGDCLVSVADAPFCAASSTGRLPVRTQANAGIRSSAAGESIQRVAKRCPFDAAVPIRIKRGTEYRDLMLRTGSWSPPGETRGRK